jgi:hypothetical protein
MNKQAMIAMQKGEKFTEKVEGKNVEFTIQEKTVTKKGHVIVRQVGREV